MGVHGPTVAQSRPIVPSAVLGMAMFIATETMFFAGLVSAFLVLRAQSPDWPPIDQPRLPVGVTGLNTLFLLASGLTIQRAAAALRRGEKTVARWLRITLGLGVLFLGIQGSEWVRLVRYGLTTWSSLYGATFYTLVGAHGLHVLAAVIALGVALRRAVTGPVPAAAAAWLTPFRMYWFFVVAVWPILYVLVYLS